MENNKEHNREQLLKHLRCGATVYTLLRHSSKSGMNRVIDLYVVHDGEILRISGYAADFSKGMTGNTKDARLTVAAWIWDSTLLKNFLTNYLATGAR